MHQSPYEPLDEAPLNRFHWRSLVTTGMGVLTDGYDLSSIGIVLPLALASFHQHSLTGVESSLLAGSALAGSALGALAFAGAANRGRKRFYGIDVTLMAVAALAQAFAPSVAWLIAIRFVLGIGVGADYVLSPMILGEHANRRDRGKIMALGFGLTWTVGAVLASLLYLGLEANGVAPALIWRIVLAAGALPAASVIYLRRRLPETPRFLLAIERDPSAYANVASDATGRTIDPPHRIAVGDEIAGFFRRRWPAVLAACSLWFLFDIVAYSGILFGPSLIAKGIGLTPATFNLAMELIATIPGALVGIALIDRIGRRRIQAAGFLGMALFLVIFATSHTAIVATPLLGALIYGGVSFSQQGGPGSVSASGLLGVELSSTKARGLVQALTVASGRAGAALTAFVFPALFAHLGEDAALLFLAGVALVALAVTLIAVPETARRALEENSGELAPAVATD